MPASATSTLSCLVLSFSREVEFYWHKQRYRVFVPPFGGLRGNVHGSSMLIDLFSLDITVEAL